MKPASPLLDGQELAEHSANWRSVTVLSPHSDDAAFSLPGILQFLHGAGKPVHIITCFSASRFSRLIKLRNPATVTRLRKREDAEYAALVGSQCSVSWFDHPDAELRTESVLAIFEERELDARALALADEILRPVQNHIEAGSAVFVPLGLGKHLDHRIVTEVGKRLVQSGPAQTLFYEEMPYSLSVPFPEIEKTVDQLDLNPRPSTVHFSCPGMAEIKRRAAACYPSQVTTAQVDGMLDRAASDAKCHFERVWVCAGRRDTRPIAC